MNVNPRAPEIDDMLNADTTVFVEGPAGGGKTALAIRRLLVLLERGVPAESILVLLPQRTLAAPYIEALRSPELRGMGEVTVATVDGLARRTITLFWPLIAEQAGFHHPDHPPAFLTLETAQHYMSRLVRPLMDKGYFPNLTIRRTRLVSQIIDNLNKAALIGLPHTGIGERLKAAWGGEPGQALMYEQAQDCADRFRQYCLEHNLLDYSLRITIMHKHLLDLPECRRYLLSGYRHLIMENAEEDTPVAHDISRVWLDRAESAWVLFDRDGGYRVFLGADPDGAYALRDACKERIELPESHVTSTELEALGYEIAHSLGRASASDRTTPIGDADPRSVLTHSEDLRFHPQMLDWVADQVVHLVQDEGVAPGEIAILAPYVGEALRFSLTEKLERRSIPVRSHRPSRALREEPAVRCLLTLAELAHPQWGRRPTLAQVSAMLTQAVEGMDLVRARLLTSIVYRHREDPPRLSPFGGIRGDMQERITYLLGQRYDDLRRWLEAYAKRGEEDALDHFLSRLFGELLSRPGYGFHEEYQASEVAANLIESVRKFRWGVEAHLPTDATSLGREYLDMVEEGVLAAQYVRSWETATDDAVFIAPVYTFLMMNRPVDYQFWIAAGSEGWWERIYQPLTHPFVLSRRWEGGRTWNDADEFEVRQDTLYRLVLGLVRRCRRRVYLGISRLGEQGYEQKGPLLVAVQRMLRRLAEEDSRARPRSRAVREYGR